MKKSIHNWTQNNSRIRTFQSFVLWVRNVVFLWNTIQKFKKFGSGHWVFRSTWLGWSLEFSLKTTKSDITSSKSVCMGWFWELYCMGLFWGLWCCFWHSYACVVIVIKFLFSSSNLCSLEAFHIAFSRPNKLCLSTISMACRAIYMRRERSRWFGEQRPLLSKSNMVTNVRLCNIIILNFIKNTQISTPVHSNEVTNTLALFWHFKKLIFAKCKKLRCIKR